MSKKLVSLQDIIDFIEVSLQDNSIKKNYNDILESCHLLGISSYALNLLIIRARENRTIDGCINEEINDVLFISNAKQENNEATENSPEVVVVNNKRLSWILFYILLLLVYGVMVAGLIFEHYDLINANEENRSLQEKSISYEAIIEKDKDFINVVCSLGHQIGSPLVYNLDFNFDSAFFMWINVKKPLRINSTYVRADKVGSIKIELYDANKILKKSVTVFVNTSFKKVELDFDIPKTGEYALGFIGDNDIKLQWHYSSDDEYLKYKNDFLEMNGCSRKSDSGESSKKTNSWYLYFYEIDYSILNLE